MEYDVFINASALEFIETILRKEGTRLLFEIRQIGKDPHKQPDFTDQGEEGELCGLLVDQYSIFYYVDPSSQKSMDCRCSIR